MFFKNNRYKYYICIIFSVFLLLSKYANSIAFPVNKMKDQEAQTQLIKKQDTVIVLLSTNPPDSLEKQREEGFRHLKSYINTNLIKASVIWQKDNYSYGKMASISNIYIKDYLEKKITREKFIEFFELEDINPSKLHKNDIYKTEIKPVSDIFIKYSQILRQNADIYRDNRDFNSAIRIYNEAIELNPNDTLSFYWIGEIYKDQKQIDKAKEYYIKALSIDPNFKAADDELYELENNQ